VVTDAVVTCRAVGSVDAAHAVDRDLLDEELLLDQRLGSDLDGFRGVGKKGIFHNRIVSVSRASLAYSPRGATRLD
jgi:hypothetical protein